MANFQSPDSAPPSIDIIGSPVGPHNPIDADQRALAVTAGLARQYEHEGSDTVVSEKNEFTEPVESIKDREARFYDFMARLSRANPTAHENAEGVFSLELASNRYKGMQAIIDRYSGYVIESTSQPDEVA